jgi:hypothetical protein
MGDRRYLQATRRPYPGFGGTPRNVTSSNTDLTSYRQNYFTPLGAPAIDQRERAPKRTHAEAFDQRGAVNMSGRSYYTNGVPLIVSKAMREGGGLPDDSQVDNTIGLEANPYINYARLSFPWEDKRFETYHYGQLVFTVKNKEFGQRWDTGRLNLAMTPMLTLQSLNYLLSMETHLGGVLPGEPGFRMRTAREIMADYTPDGFVVVQGGGPDFSGAAEKGQERTDIVNNCVYGNARQVLKIWGNDIQAATRLFLLIRRVDWREYAPLYAPEGFNIDPTGQFVKPERDGPEFVDNPFQVIPWCSHREGHPPDSVLRYEDDTGATRYGSYIEVGRVDSPEGAVNVRRELGTTWTSAKAAFNSGQMDVFVSIHLLKP